jgi:hypothetical protein
MEHKNEMDTAKWVDLRLATLDPSSDWQPNAYRALSQLRDRGQLKKSPRRSWLWAATAACLACLTVIAFPGSRAVAERLWNSFFLNKIDVVRLDLDDAPLNATLITNPGPPQPVSTSEEAARLTGFTPRLPSRTVLPAAPKLVVTGRMAIHLNVDTAELKAGLRRSGASEIRVPKNWDTATLSVHAGPMIIADYPEISLMQCRPITLTTPTGFVTKDFAEATFRMLGLNGGEARQLAQKFAANPSWLFGIPQDEPVEIQEMALRSGPGMLIEDFDENGQSERLSIVWSVADRIYALSGKMTRELAIATANSLEE